uniref:AP2 domain containing protein, putative n=1 Tax=Theileria annulata TaxID=5874 RepID=A0A3B0MZM9_THEAN
MNVEKMEINESDRIVNGLRRSIRTALEVGSAIKKKINSDYKPLIDTLNVALLSTFRLGEYLFTHSNSNSIDDTRESYKSESFTEINKSTYKSESFKSEYDTKLNNLQSYESNTTLNNSPTVQSNVQCNSPSTVQSNVQTTIPSTIQSNMESIRNESYMISNEMRENEEMEDVGELIYMDIGMESMSSTFENDQYLNYDIMSEDDGSSFTSLSSSSPKMFNKRKSPSRSRRPYRSLSSLENLPSSRRSTRDLSQTDDMYIYDMNNLSDKGEFEDWYNEDSDSSKKSVKYVQKRMPPSRPSVSNLTEIYGSQDMLIPMGPLPIGVYFDASRKLWRCQWRENGKFRTKGFSLGHYNTLADARHACILFRCQVGNMNIQPEWLTPNYIKVSELLNRKASQPSNNTPKKSNRKKKRQEDLYEPFS